MITYRNICKKIIPIFSEQIQNQTDYEVYLYALESFLSTLVNFLVIILIGILFHITDYVLFYLLFFTPFRYFEGGRHEKNHVRCISLYLFFMITC